jgi:hypothetical protein
VLASAAFNADIRMGSLQIIESMLQGGLTIPYVDRLNDGKTPFIWSHRDYIGDYDGADIQTVVPALVGSVDPGIPIEPVSFVPNTAAFTPSLEQIHTSTAMK